MLTESFQMKHYIDSKPKYTVPLTTNLILTHIGGVGVKVLAIMTWIKFRDSHRNLGNANITSINPVRVAEQVRQVEAANISSR